jgi:hypothetical protein
MVDEEYRKILNVKVEQIRERYEVSLLQLEDLIGRQYEKIVSFKALEELGNVGIAFDEQTPDEVIQKLALINKSPKIIWAAFSKHYSPDFFFDIIEEEFGVTPGTTDMLIERFDKKVDDYKVIANQKLDETSAKFVAQINLLKANLRDKSIEMLNMKSL